MLRLVCIVVLHLLRLKIQKALPKQCNIDHMSLMVTEKRCISEQIPKDHCIIVHSLASRAIFPCSFF
ncbi:hypothetical protein DICVIV_09266 [Dictyocaulus viviparus]|uniref:Secreted protein n=1 Tax=Dictyocaulus viviparus TaxID=29172 RepID=A0A0D8XLQ6_DICVI|nr:hypothetical protein DICVIV_09266 [Dictyocaulus viviparus]